MFYARRGRGRLPFESKLSLPAVPSELALFDMSSFEDDCFASF